MDIDLDGYNEIVSSYGTLFWCEVFKFVSEGFLTSSILDTACSPQWASMNWNSNVPAGTDLFFQYRTSDNPGEMGMWSDPLFAPCLLSDSLDRYFQYKVVMESNSAVTSPSLFDFTLQWDPLSIDKVVEPILSGITLLSISPNPSIGSSVVRFGLPEPSYVSFSIFDLSGRFVSEIPGSNYSSGYHVVQLQGEMSSGGYFCSMISGDFTAEQRFVVIE